LVSATLTSVAVDQSLPLHGKRFALVGSFGSVKLTSPFSTKIGAICLRMRKIYAENKLSAVTCWPFYSYIGKMRFYFLSIFRFISKRMIHFTIFTWKHFKHSFQTLWCFQRSEENITL
jgi:hypothetical protein